MKTVYFRKARSLNEVSMRDATVGIILCFILVVIAAIHDKQLGLL